MLTVFQQGFIALVRAGVTRKKQILPEGFDISNIYKVAKFHHLCGIVYEGAVLCGIDTELNVMKQLFIGTLKEMAIHEQQVREFEIIGNLFNDNGINYMPIKGVRIKKLYSEPSNRYMNDIDILIRDNDHDKIKELITKCGYKFYCESRHEYIYRKDNLFLELHKSLVSSRNKEFYNYFRDGWSRAINKDKFEYCLNDGDEFIYLFCHFAKHYRAGGIGIKYLIDLWLIREKFSMDVHYVKQELDKLGLLEFYNNINDVIDFWFCGAVNTKKTDFISNYIILSGAYGNHENEVAFLLLQQENGKVLSSTNSKKRLLKMRIFPKLSVMKIKYKYLHKYPFLIGFAYISRIITTFIKKKKNIKMHLKDLKQIDENKLKELKESLEYVGLNV